MRNSAAIALALGLVPGVSAATEPASRAPGPSGLVTRLVRAYHAGDADALRPHLAPGFVFHDPGLRQRLDLPGFLKLVEEMGTGERDRALEISWTGITGGHADVRGTWRWVDVESGRKGELKFSIEIELESFDGEPRVVSWLDDFRRRGMWKPARGDGRLETEHFAIVYFENELTVADAVRLGETFEHWYGRTADFLGRSFTEGYRLHVNVAGGHGSPYASDPGPEAFILVSTRSARRAYGFSLVHELTHNLMGLSWLCRNEHERDGVPLASGNRLFDEGFAVTVEEKLTGEGPRVWPNFGEETHAAYWRLREELGQPEGSALEAEILREHGDTRLGYLAQASFCKYLVDTKGLESFLRLFAADPASAAQIYGLSFAELEAGWRDFLRGRFGEPPVAGAGD